MTLNDRAALANSIAAMIQGTDLTIDEVAAALTGTAANGTTFGELCDQVLPTLHEGTRRTYRTTLDRACNGVDGVCDCRCDKCVAPVMDSSRPDWCPCGPDCGPCAKSKITIEPLRDVVVSRATIRKPTLKQLCIVAQRVAEKRAIGQNARRSTKGLAPMPTHGNGARETAVRALKLVLEAAVDLDLLTENPMTRVKAPRRKKTTKRGLRDSEFAPFFDAVASGGNDIELDLLLSWFHLETGARRIGAVSLTLDRLLSAEQAVEVTEKFGDIRRQPVSAELIDALRDHARQRGGPAADPSSDEYTGECPVFYYRPQRDGTPHPLTDRRYDSLFGRVQRELSFANEIRLTAHGLRKGAGTVVERLGGTQVARLFLGHGDRSDADLYAESWMEELADVVSLWTGSPHPLATPTADEPDADEED